MDKRLRTGGDKGPEKGKLEPFKPLLSTSAFRRHPAVLHQHLWPQSVVVCVCKLCLYVCLFTPMTPLALWAQLPSPQLRIHWIHWLALAPSPQSLIGSHTPGRCLCWVRKPEGTNVESSLLFWFLLTGVNCYHKAWRMAPYVSVVMWACLALRNMERIRSFFAKLSVFFSN